jgi:hypothetical protein
LCLRKLHLVKGKNGTYVGPVRTRRWEHSVAAAM